MFSTNSTSGFSFYQHGEVEKDVQKNLVVECLENNLISTVFHGTVKNLESLQSGSWGCLQEEAQWWNIVWWSCTPARSNSWRSASDIHSSKCVHFVFINVLEFAVLFTDSHFLNVYKKKMNYLGYCLFIYYLRLRQKSSTNINIFSSFYI